MKVVEFLHVKKGKGPAFVRIKLKDISTGKVIDETFNSGVKLEFLKIEAKEMQYLYMTLILISLWIIKLLLSKCFR